MNNPTTGWTNWERQLNEKTASHRNRTEQLTKLRRWIFFWLEIVLFLLACALITAFACGNMHVVVFQAAISVVTALMSFCAGYFLGATKH